jgi:hypothetical protein
MIDNLHNQIFNFNTLYWDHLKNILNSKITNLNSLIDHYKIINPNKNMDSSIKIIKAFQRCLDNLNNDKRYYLGALDPDSNNLIKPIALQRQTIMEDIINGNLNINRLNYFLNLNNIILNTNNILDIQNNNSLIYWKHFECFTLKFFDSLHFIDCDNKNKLSYVIRNIKENLILNFTKFIIDRELEYFLLYEIDPVTLKVVLGYISEKNIHSSIKIIVNYF